MDAFQVYDIVRYIYVILNHSIIVVVIKATITAINIIPVPRTGTKRFAGIISIHLHLNCMAKISFYSLLLIRKLRLIRG